jgi:deaminated glutathione amidase
MRAAAIQMHCSTDRDGNLDRAAALVAEAAAKGADLVVLPELFASLGRTAEMHAAAEPLEGPTAAWASALARRHHCSMVAGSFVERDGDQMFNTSILLDPDGTLIAHYRKVHLFDVEVDGATSRESDIFRAGDDAVVAALPDDTTIGLTICYDLRFPELFRIEALRGATIIAAPSAFTGATGRDHWHLLVRARALENQVALIAAAQWGSSPDGVARYGHALIVDAWGTVIAEAPAEGDCVIVADIDPTAIERDRRRLPSLANRRPTAYRWPD